MALLVNMDQISFDNLEIRELPTHEKAQGGQGRGRVKEKNVLSVHDIMPESKKGHDAIPIQTTTNSEAQS